MNKGLKIGLIGLDTSHVTKFTEVLNDPAHPHYVPGGKVVAGFPGGSPDFPPSASRVAAFTNELRQKYAVKIVDSVEAVAEMSDLIFIMSVDGRVHLDQFRRIVKFRKPVFIDKPLALSVADAKQIFDLADQHGVAVMSCSALRYSEPLNAALAAAGSPEACIIWGPMHEEPTQPGLFWYGIHCIEMLVRIMGVGCQTVHAATHDRADCLAFTWPDGRTAMLHGLRGSHTRFGAVLHHKDSFVSIDASASSPPYYATMLRAIMQSLPSGRSAIPREEMLEVIRLIEAANAARKLPCEATLIPR